jgi:hypothetical protein
MTLEELKVWMKVSSPIDWNTEYDSCTNELEQRIWKRDDKLWAIDFCNDHPSEVWGEKGFIRDVYEPYEVTKETRMVEITEYHPVKKEKDNKMTGLMIQYLRGAKNVKRGVMVAFKEGENVYVGYSLCMKSDKFNKEEGLAVAVERAKADFANATPSIAPSVKDSMEKFKGRVTRYFKDGVKPVWVA